MKEGWKEFRLNELIKINNGKNYSHLNEGKTPVYGSGGIMCYVDSFLHDGEAVLLPRKGTLNNILYTKGRIWTVDTMYYATVNENANPYYLYCYLNILKLDQLDSGSSLPSMTQSIYYNVKVKLPELKVQQRIASILSAYDDLIEVNNKRIELLEQSARELYKEWFVRMRFPNYQNTKFNKGIPEGWEEKNLGDILELAYGKALKEEERIDGIFPVYGSSGIVGYHEVPLIKAPSIIVGRKGNVGSVFLSFKDCYPIDTVFYIKSTYSLFYLYFLLKFQSFIDGDAAVPGLNRNYAYKNKILLPNIEIIDVFAKYCESIYNLIENLQKQNQQLTEIRNRLLPRLISGKLEVKE